MLTFLSMFHTTLKRHAWYPYFDDINAIIFLAPISAFDQVLAEVCVHGERLK